MFSVPIIKWSDDVSGSKASSTIRTQMFTWRTRAYHIESWHKNTVVGTVCLEEVVVDSDSLGLLTNVEVGTKSALHGSSPFTKGRNGKAERDRDIVDSANSNKRMSVFEGAEKGRTIAGYVAVAQLTIGNVNILDLEGVKEDIDVLG
jgi:hypothetical protein